MKVVSFYVQNSTMLILICCCSWKRGWSFGLFKLSIEELNTRNTFWLQGWEEHPQNFASVRPFSDLLDLNGPILLPKVGAMKCDLNTTEKWPSKWKSSPRISRENISPVWSNHYRGYPPFLEGSTNISCQHLGYQDSKNETARWNFWTIRIGWVPRWSMTQLAFVIMATANLLASSYYFLTAILAIKYHQRCLWLPMDVEEFRFNTIDRYLPSGLQLFLQ